MGHHLQGILVRSADAPRASAALDDAEAFPLDAAISFLPLHPVTIGAVLGKTPGAAVPGFNGLSEDVLQALADLSTAFDLAYIETNYFGSAGDQGAAFFSAGQQLYLARAQRGPINHVLSHLGVIASSQDEFETAGLHRYRSNDRFIED